MVFTFDVTTFRTWYPEFANVDMYPELLLQMYWDTAADYISTCNTGVLCGNQRKRALYLLTAHIAKLASDINAGNTPNLPQSATIDKISVSLTPPPVSDEFDWWLNLTGYGQQLLTLLSIAASGGLFFGGAPNRAAFRGPYG